MATLISHNEFSSIDDCLIQVGVDARSNNRLSLCTSHPSEWWMHWEGGPGAHVVICCRDDYIQAVLPETVKDAATLALRHSKANPIDSKTYAITLTRPCYLQKPKGAKDGMVQIMSTHNSQSSGNSSTKGKKKPKPSRKLKQSMTAITDDTIVQKYFIKYDESRYQRVLESKKPQVRN